MTYPLKRSCAFAALGLILALLAHPASGQIVGGVINTSFQNKPAESREAIQEEFQALLAQALSPKNVAEVTALSSRLARVLEQTTYLTDFDDVTAPCLFSDTEGPLYGRHQNAFFSGFNGNGGAILDQCSNFGVDAFSQPNFLAFNRLNNPPPGAFILPELIVVGPDKSNVSLWVSGGALSGYPIAAIAIGQHAVKGMVTTTTTSDWVQLTLSAPGIQSVLLVGNPAWLVVDNIEAQ